MVFSWVNARSFGNNYHKAMARDIIHCGKQDTTTILIMNALDTEIIKVLSDRLVAVIQYKVRLNVIHKMRHFNAADIIHIVHC